MGKTEKKLDRRSIKVNMLTLMLLFDRRSKPEPVSDGFLKGSVCRLCCADKTPPFRKGGILRNVGPGGGKVLVIEEGPGEALG